MPPKPSTPHGKALDRALADGQWHPRTAVTDLVAGHVPPGRAHRHAEHDRTRTNPGPRTRGHTTTAITAGQHDIARRTINRRLQNGAIEQADIDGTTMIRRRPT